MARRPVRTVRCDGSPASVARLTEALAEALAGSGPAVLALSATGSPPTDPPARDTAVLVTTSGSTGEPRTVELSAAALRTSAAATASRLGGPASWLLALPAEHIAGLQVIVRALLAGGVPTVQDLRGGFRPGDLAAAIAAMPSGRRCTSLVPTQLQRVLEDGRDGLAALGELDAVLVGGAALAPALRARAEDAGVAVVATYGMSETAGGCVYDGAALDGVTVDLDPAGRIVLGGPTLATGYLGRPDLTAAAFTGGRFRTGDLGRLAGGRLEVLGRADDVIVTGGEKVAPAAVERVLVETVGVRAACVVGLPDPQWGAVVAAALVVDPAAPPDTQVLRDRVRTVLGRAAVPRRMVVVDALPLRGVGKPDRLVVAQLLELPPYE